MNSSTIFAGIVAGIPPPLFLFLLFPQVALSPLFPLFLVPRSTVLCFSRTPKPPITQDERHAEQRRQRVPVPHRPRHSHGRPHAPVLASRDPLGRTAIARLPASSRQASGRGAHRLPRDFRGGRPDPELVPPPRRFLVLRPQRRRRPALRLPRLEVGRLR